VEAATSLEEIQKVVAGLGQVDKAEGADLVAAHVATKSQLEAVLGTLGEDYCGDATVIKRWAEQKTKGRILGTLPIQSGGTD
jgi:hypothetical protein